MKVVLLRDISKLGQRGSIVEVANGYGTNVLIAKGWAKLATNTVVNEIEQKEAAKLHKKELAKSLFLQMIDKLRQTPITITGRKHNNGSLFATVSPKELVDEIFKSTGLSIQEKQIHIEKPIKHQGAHQIFLEEGGKREAVQIIVKTN
jgi:large subunit ribosomal protein L9